MAKATTRQQFGILAAVIALGAFGLAGPAGADKAAPRPLAEQPADDITGQDHPADVFVEAWQYIPPTVHVKGGSKIKFGNYDLYPYGAGVSAHSLQEAIPGCTAPPYKSCDRHPRFASALV